MMERVDVNCRMLKKTCAVKEDRNCGDGARDRPGEWVVFVGTGYQGAQTQLRMIQPKRKPRGSTLDHDDLCRNSLVFSDHVLVENFFGRLNKLWRVMSATYNWNKNRFGTSGTRTNSIDFAHLCRVDECLCAAPSALSCRQ